MKVVTPNGNKIATLRKEQNKKQIALAKDIGISERMLRDIENKSKPINEQTLVNIATSLKVSPEELQIIEGGEKKIIHKLNHFQEDDFGFLQMRLFPVVSGSDLFKVAQSSN